MCDLPHLHDLPPLDEDKFLLDTPRVLDFITAVRQRIGRADSPADACTALSPAFADLLADRDYVNADCVDAPR